MAQWVSLMFLDRDEEAKDVLKEAGKRSKHDIELSEMIVDALSEIENSDVETSIVLRKRNVFYVDVRKKKTPPK